jgi:hypothetical protein
MCMKKLTQKLFSSSFLGTSIECFFCSPATRVSACAQRAARPCAMGGCRSIKTGGAFEACVSTACCAYRCRRRLVDKAFNADWQLGERWRCLEARREQCVALSRAQLDDSLLLGCSDGVPRSIETVGALGHIFALPLAGYCAHLLRQVALRKGWARAPHQIHRARCQLCTRCARRGDDEGSAHRGDHSKV